METPITSTVTSNETNVRFKPLLILNTNFCRHLTDIKSVWLVIREGEFLAIALNIPQWLKTGFWVQGHIWRFCGSDKVQCVLFICSWLICGIAMACFWARSGKQEQSTQVQSFHTTCGPDHHSTCARCGPHLGRQYVSIWGFLYYCQSRVYCSSLWANYLSACAELSCEQRNTIFLSCFKIF